MTISPDHGYKFELIYVTRGKYAEGKPTNEAANILWAEDTGILNSYLGTLKVVTNSSGCTITYGSSGDNNVVVYAVQVPT